MSEAVFTFGANLIFFGVIMGEATRRWRSRRVKALEPNTAAA